MNEKAAGLGCVVVLAIAGLGVIGAIGGDDTDNTSASGPACTALKTDGFPARETGVTAKTGKASCDDTDTVLPITITNETNRLLTVDLALRLHRGKGSELETVLVEEELTGGERLKETADIYPWGELDEASGPITVRVDELKVTEGPASEPTEDVDVPDADVDRPKKCGSKWYC